MRIAFMGTPLFSVAVLEALVKTSHEIVAVYSQPPRPQGRGHHVHKSPVQAYAEQHNIPVHTPYNFKDPQDIKLFQDLNLDLAVVVAYGLLLPQAILDAPKQGCVNIHASLLPRWRGAAPIQRAIEAGDIETGICLMKMEAGLDTGPVYATAAIPIGHMNSEDLQVQLCHLGANLLIEKLDQLHRITPIAQPHEGVTYAKKITKEEGLIDWNKDVHVLERASRAFTPWPGLYFTYKDESIRLWKATFEQAEHNHKPGTVVDQNFSIACTGGYIKPLLLQRPSKKALPLVEFLRGLPIPKGTDLCLATS